MSSKKKGKKTKEAKNAYVKNLDDEYNNNDDNNVQKAKINSLPTLDYIRITVQKEVQQGLLNVARARPDNPIEYLGKFLLGESKKKKYKIYK